MSHARSVFTSSVAFRENFKNKNEAKVLTIKIQWCLF